MWKELFILHLIIAGVFGAPPQRVKPVRQNASVHSKNQVPNYVETPVESCPTGYVMESGVCVQYINVPSIPSCPKNTVYNDGRCMEITPPIKQCPEGFEISGKQCTATRTAPLQASCPPGTVQKGNDCITTHTIDSICPPGYVDNGSECVAFQSPVKECPPGYNMSGKQCVQSDTAPPSPECPPGSKYDNGTCKIASYVDTICPPGYLDEGSKCLQFAQPNRECPPGYNFSGQQCIAPEITDIIISCPIGTIMEASQCKAIKSVDATCPPGYSDSGDECVVYTPPAKECPPGFELQGHQCIKMMSAAFQPVCPPGTVIQDGSCISVDMIDTICPPGYMDNGKDCIKYAPVKKECPTSFEFSSNRCVQLLSAPAELECPPGTILSNDSCTAVELVDTVCPPSFLENGEDCVQFTNPEKACPNNFILSGKQCVQTETAPRSPQCPPGTTMSPDGSCFTLQIVDAVCPPGYLDSNDSCSKYVPASKQCPSGYTIAGSQCIQTVVATPQPECPPGTVLRNTQCVSTQKLNSVCPPGYIDNGHNCIQFVQPKRECPSGYELVGKQCERIQESPPQQQCPPGYSSQNNMCVAMKLIDAVCPEEWLDNGNDCIQFSPASRICPSGFSLQGDQCLRTNIQPKEPECPVGTVMDNNQCQRLVPASLVYVCSQGIREGDVCVDRKVTLGQYECPPSYHLESGKQCIKTSQFDCSTTTYVHECRTPEYTKALRRLAGKEKPEPMYNIPTMHSKEPMRPICEDVPKIIPKTCTKTDAVPAVLVCEKGAEIVGKECVYSKYTPLEAVCEDGSSSKECAKYQTFPPNYICPSGYTEIHGQCQKNEFIMYDLVCPAGYQLVGDKCAITRKKVCPNDNCQKPVSISPSLICPPGFQTVGEEKIMSVGHGHGHGHSHGHHGTYGAMNSKSAVRCIHHDYSPYSLLCPTGFRLIADRCAAYSEKVCPNNNCEEMHTQPAEFVCPKGYIPNTHHSVMASNHHHGVTQVAGVDCIKTNTISYELLCPPGYHIEADMCVEKTQKICPDGNCENIIPTTPTFSCPPGFHMSNAGHLHSHGQSHGSGHSHGHMASAAHGECIRTKYEEYQLSCPPGHSLLGDKCAIFTNKICPNAKCERVITTSPKLVCPPGFGSNRLINASSHGHGHGHSANTPVQECTKSIYAPYGLVCEIGFVPHGDKCVQYTRKECPNGSCEQLVKTNPMLECPPGYNKPQVGVSTRSHGHKNMISTVNQCIRSIFEPYELICPPGYRLLGDTCQQTSQKSCSNGNCSKVIYIPPLQSCPPEYERSGDKCMANKYEDYALTCPKGLILVADKCVKYTEKVCPNNDCERFKTIPPEMVCPPGYTVENGISSTMSRSLGHHGHGHGHGHSHGHGHTHHSHGHAQVYAPEVVHNIVQVEVPVIEPVVEVPVVRTTICVRELYTPYELLCPQGSQLIGDRCASFTEKVCPNGSCEKLTSTPISMSCPTGYVTDRDNTCYVVEYAPYGHFCPEPFVLFENKECVLFTKPDSKCPQGSDRTSQGCVKKVVTTPIISYDSSCIGPKCEL